ncbi:MAG: glycosyltransferase family 4 protein [Planctomycetales bacterium]
MSQMKIAYIAAGAGGMYCGNCLHDNTLARALLDEGHDVLLIPTYTPLKTDEVNVSMDRVFFGGINVYLQQKSALFRHTPWFLDGLLDSPRMLDWAVQRGMSMQAEDLGALTVSMLQGEDGKQRKELDKLIEWLKKDVRPDVVHLSNILLAGMARRIRDELNVPVVCTLSGEDLFLDELTEPHASQARDLLREKIGDLDALVALNQYYADHMAKYLSADEDRIHVIPHGLDLTGHDDQTRTRDDDEFVLGYLARIAPEKGLHLLVEAFKLLSAEESTPKLRLKAAGYLGPSNREYLDGIETHLREAGLSDSFEYVGEVDRPTKIAFLQSLDCLSMPTIYQESKGLPVLEAMANGVPVVVPDHGAFPEIIKDAGGGLLCEPENPRGLADAIKRYMVDCDLAQSHGEAGRQAIHDRYTSQLMAERTLALYRRLSGAPAKPVVAPEPCAAEDPST